MKKIVFVLMFLLLVSLAVAQKQTTTITIDFTGTGIENNPAALTTAFNDFQKALVSIGVQVLSLPSIGTSVASFEIVFDPAFISQRAIINAKNALGIRQLTAATITNFGSIPRDVISEEGTEFAQIDDAWLKLLGASEKLRQRVSQEQPPGLIKFFNPFTAAWDLKSYSQRVSDLRQAAGIGTQTRAPSEPPNLESHLISVGDFQFFYKYKLGWKVITISGIETPVEAAAGSDPLSNLLSEQQYCEGLRHIQDFASNIPEDQLDADIITLQADIKGETIVKRDQFGSAAVFGFTASSTPFDNLVSDATKTPAGFRCE